VPVSADRALQRRRQHKRRRELRVQVALGRTGLQRQEQAEPIIGYLIDRRQARIYAPGQPAH
jgi:hypothetical protein